MPYAIETYEAGRRVGREVIEGTEPQAAIDRPKGLATPSNVTFVRVIQIDSEGDENGLEIWSERREGPPP
jgi:hypothetical protein